MLLGDIRLILFHHLIRLPQDFYNKNPTGQIISLNILGGGEMFGELALFGDGLRPASVRPGGSSTEGTAHEGYLRGGQMPLVVFLVLLLAFPQLCRAEDVPYSAIVMRVKGKAVVRHNGNSMPVDLGYLLYAGDEVTITKSASLTINYLESGSEEEWPGGMKFVVGKTGSTPAVSRVKKTARNIILPKVEYQQTGSLKLRGSGDAVQVQGLSNTCTIEERPAFRWNPITAADQYKVTLYREFKDEPSWRRTTKDSEMPFPENEPSLSFGFRYEWEIEALENGTVIAARRSGFCLPGRDELDRMQERLKSYRAQLSNDPTDSASQLALIFYLEQHRMYDEAIKQYQALRRVHGKSDSTRKREEILVDIRNADCNPWPE